MAILTNDPCGHGLKRIFFAQLGLIFLLSALVAVGYVLESSATKSLTIGTFWFAFVCGGIGASVTLFRRAKASTDVRSAVGVSWISVMIPILYGCLMAGVAYLLFMSGILGGDGKEGFVTSNLFPRFGAGPDLGSESVSIMAFTKLRPESIPDAGKLLVWSFIAGSSESFVSGMLSHLESSGNPSDA